MSGIPPRFTVPPTSHLRSVPDGRRYATPAYTDAFRHLNPEAPGFTWWDYRAGHFPKGYGLRIDHALVSTHLAPRLEAATVERAYRKVSTVPGTKPSDHAPLLVRLGTPGSVKR